MTLYEWSLVVLGVMAGMAVTLFFVAWFGRDGKEIPRR